MRHVDQHCTVEAEDGLVLLECGHAAVSLDPAVAARAGVKLQHHAEVAKAQRLLPPVPLEY